MTSSSPAGVDPSPVQRVDITERRLHPAYLLIALGRNIRWLLPLIAVGIWHAPGWSIGLLAGLVGLHAVAQWWTRRYSVVDGSLRVRSGLFQKEQHTIGANRITALDAERGVVQRMFGVWGLKVQTPGTDHRSALHLSSLSVTALEELRSALHQSVPVLASTVHAGQPADGKDEADGHHPAVTIAVLRTRALLTAALTGTSIPLIFAGAAATFGRVRDVLPERVTRRLTGEVLVGGRTTVLILLAAVTAAVLGGIALTSLRLARFTLIRDGGQLRISRGLIAQRSGSIPVDRVQAVRLVEGWWRRMLGYCALEVEVAGLSSTNDTERTLFPLVRTSKAAELIDRALPEMQWHPAPLQPVPARARRRYFTLPFLVGVALAAALALLPGWGVYLGIAPIPLALLVGWGQARAAAWSIDAATVTFRWHRVLSRHTVIARRQRVQLVEVTRTPFQRRAGLSGARMLLSSKRKARMRHVEAEDALMLLHTVGRPQRMQDAPEPAGPQGAAPYRER